MTEQEENKENKPTFSRPQLSHDMSNLWHTFSLQDLTKCLVKVRAEFGDTDFFSHELANWMTELYKPEEPYSSRSVGRHLFSLKLPSHGKRGNRRVYRLDKDTLAYLRDVAASPGYKAVRIPDRAEDY